MGTTRRPAAEGWRRPEDRAAAAAAAERAAAGAERDERTRGNERGVRRARFSVRLRSRSSPGPAAAACPPDKAESPRPQPCPRQPAAATSPARAAPSPPAPWPSAMPRSYLMTIAPRPGGRSSPPHREELESFMTESFCWIVAILPWLRPHPAICPISQESLALAP